MSPTAPRAAASAAAGYDRGESGYRRIVVALFCSGFATFALLYDVQAVLPLISRDLGIPASSSALTISVATVALACSVLPWASVADRWGRTRAMTVSILTAAALGLLTPVMPTLPLVLVARGLEGAALGALPAVAMAYLAEEIRPRSVPVAAGTFIAGNTIGGLAGRIVAGPVGDWLGWRAGLGCVAALATVAAVAFVVIVPPARGFVPLSRRAVTDAALPLRTRLRVNLTDPGMWALYLQGFFLMGCLVAVYNYLGYRLEAPPFGLSTTLASMLFLVYLSGTVSARVAGQIVGRVGHGRVIAAGILLMVLGLLATIPDNPWAVLAGLLVFTVGYFAAHPMANTWTGQRAQAGRAQASALYQLLYYAGSSLFGWWVGTVFGQHGWTALVSVVIAMCAASGLAAVLGLGVLGGVRPRVPEPAGRSTGSS